MAAGTYNLNKAYGASDRDAFKSAVVAGISAAAFNAIGRGGVSTESVIAGGVVGGVSSGIQGGNVGHGFLSAGIGVAAGGGQGYSVPGAIKAAVVGGTVSYATGGKFANGAATATFAYAMAWGAKRYGPGGVDAKFEESEAGAPAQYEYVPEADRQAYLEKSLSEFKAWVEDSNIPLDNRMRAEKLTVAYDSEYKRSAIIEYEGEGFGKITVGREWFLTTRGRRLELGAADARYVASLDSKGYDRFRWAHELAHLDPAAIRRLNSYQGPNFKTIPWHNRFWERDASNTAVQWLKGN